MFYTLPRIFILIKAVLAIGRINTQFSSQIITLFRIQISQTQKAMKLEFDAKSTGIDPSDGTKIIQFEVLIL